MKFLSVKAALVGAASLGLVGCASFIEDYKSDPVTVTDPTQVPTDNLLVGMQSNTIRITEGDMARLASILSNQATGADRQYQAFETYTVTPGDFDDFWDDAYVDVLAQARVVQEAAGAEGNTQMVAIAQVYEAMVFAELAALFGNVPYSQALQFPEFSNPAYDAQASVYAGIQSLLDQAIANFGGSGNISADIALGGDADTWIEVAHSLKARYYLHTGEWANAVTHANQGISSSANDWYNTHGQVIGGNVNLWYDFHQINREGYLTATTSELDRLLTTDRNHAKTDEAARRAFYYVGVQGVTADINTGTGGMFAIDAPSAVITYVETQLTLAEAYARQGQNANAITALNAARAQLQADFPTGTYTDFVLADFQVGGIEYDGSSESSSLSLEIMEERYASLFGTLQVFHDIRRTDNEIGLTSKDPGSPTTTTLPERFLVPQIELNSNASAPTGITLYDPTPLNE